MFEYVSIGHRKVSSKEEEIEERERRADNWWREVLGETTWDEVKSTGGSDCKFDSVVTDYSKNIYERRLTSWHFLTFPTE